MLRPWSPHRTERGQLPNGFYCVCWWLSGILFGVSLAALLVLRGDRDELYQAVSLSFCLAAGIICYTVYRTYIRWVKGLRRRRRRGHHLRSLDRSDVQYGVFERYVSGITEAVTDEHVHQEELPHLTHLQAEEAVCSVAHPLDADASAMGIGGPEVEMDLDEEVRETAKDASDAEPQQDEICTICLEVLDVHAASLEDQPMKLLVCGHTYHRCCLRSWTMRHGHVSCPTCRQSWPQPKQPLQVSPASANHAAAMVPENSAGSREVALSL